MWTPLLLLAISPSRADPRAIQAHLVQVEQDLRASTPSDLPPDLRASRLQHLDRLHAYIERGRFPHNHRWPQAHERAIPLPGSYPAPEGQSATPIFVDEHGTHCAVAWLAAESDAQDLVQRVVAQENTSYLLEMNVDGLSEWAATTGFTPQELARIQPGYGYQVRECEDWTPNKGAVDAALAVTCTDGSDLFALDPWEKGSVAGYACFPDCSEQVVQLWIEVGNQGGVDSGAYTVTISSGDVVVATAAADPLPPSHTTWHGPFELDPAAWGDGVSMAITGGANDCDPTNNTESISVGDKSPSTAFPNANWDMDYDGYEDVDCGGDDCDDDNDQINPAALDPSTDGTDQDCDGVDGDPDDEPTGDGGTAGDAGSDDSHIDDEDPGGCGSSAAAFLLLPLALGLRRRRRG